jgi:subtilisin family serine protease
MAVLLLLGLLSAPAHARSTGQTGGATVDAAVAKAAVVEGVLTIKFSPEVMPSVFPGRSGDVMAAGIPSVDRLHSELQVVGMERVFRPAGRHEARHIAWGLDRWYRLTFRSGQALDMRRALTRYEEDPNIEVSAPAYAKQVHGFQAGPRAAAARVAAVAEEAQALTETAGATASRSDQQWHFHNTGQTGGTPGADINLRRAHDVSRGSSDVVVQIIDGGIQVDHPDLRDALWVNPCEEPDGEDTCGNGYVDDVNGYNFADDSPRVEPAHLLSELQSHGTHVAGLIAAANNGQGVASVAGGDGTAGSGVRIMPSVTFGNRVGGFAEAIVYGADNGAVISSNSWGYEQPGVYEPVVLDAIDYFVANAGSHDDAPMRGGLFITSAGNAGADAPYYPGYHPVAMAVAATDHHDRKASYSNYGPWVDLAAPGGEPFAQPIISTLHTAHGTYGGPRWAGTSMAAPQVAGVAALLLSAEQNLTPDGVRERLVHTGAPVDGGTPVGRRLDAYHALTGKSHTDDPAQPLAQLSPNALRVRVSPRGTEPTDVRLENTSGRPVTFALADAALPPHLHISPMRGTVAPHEAQPLSVSIDGAGLSSQSRRDTLSVLLSAGADTSTLRLPVMVEVTTPLAVTLPPVEVHPNETFRLPITVESLEAVDVQAFQFTLTYAPDRLDVLDVSIEGTLGEEAGLAIHKPAPGTLSVAAVSPGPDHAPAPLLSRFSGEGPLLYLVLRANEHLGATRPELSAVLFNDGQGESPVAVVENGAVSVVPLMGDIALNLSVSSFDAALALQHDVGLTPLSEVQQAAGDVSGSGTVGAFDAALIQQYVVGLIDAFPTGAGSATRQSHHGPDAQATLRWGAPAPGASEQQVDLPLILAPGADAVTALSLQAAIDPAAAEVTGISFHAPDDWLTADHTEEGMVRLALAGATPLPQGLVATLHIRRHRPGGALLGPAQAAVNEQTARELAPAASAAPDVPQLGTAYPNPFRMNVSIPYTLSEATHTRLTVYNALGRRVQVLVDAMQDAGQHTATWDGVTREGRPAAAGVYFYRLEAMGATRAGRLVRLR